MTAPRTTHFLPVRLERVIYGVRMRLALLVLALALPFGGYSIISAIQDADIERVHVSAQMLGTARVTAARLDDQISDIRSILQVLTAVVSVDPLKTAANDALLHGMGGDIPLQIENLSVWTTAGENIGVLDTRLRRNGPAVVATRRFFREALAGNAFSAEAPIAALASGTTVSAFAVPVWREGRIVGVVAATVRLAALQAVLTAGSDMPPDAVITVLNRRGMILARSVDPDKWVGQTLKSSAGSSASQPYLAGPDGARDQRSADGVERIAGMVRTKDAPWQVYVGVPKDVVLAPVYGRLRNHLTSAGLILLMGFAIGAAMGESIAAPLRQLDEDALKLGAGDLAHRSRVVAKSEVGELARTLNDMAERLQAQSLALTSSQQQLRQVTDNLPALISYLDVDERFQFANQVYETWLGQSPGALRGRSLLELYGPDAYANFKGHIHTALAGQRVSYSRELTTLQGPRDVDVTAVPDVDRTGRVLGLFVMMVDVTARRDAERALLDSEQRLRMLADNMPAMVTYVDRDERYRFVNAYLGSVFHIAPELLLGRTMRETGGPRLYAHIEPHAAAALRGELVTFQGTFPIKGKTYHYQSTYVPDIGAEGVRGFYAMTFDITALKETQRRLDELARVDSLTELPNRRQFEERLAEAMARTRRTCRPLALMFLDIDHFKTINDTRGHAAGDLVLKEFGARLKRQVRATDVVARLAGDEFVILLEGVRHGPELQSLAQKIVGAIRPAFRFEGQSLEVTTSVGVSVYEGGEATMAKMFASADLALYDAKQMGRDRFSIAADAPALVAEPAAAA